MGISGVIRQCVTLKKHNRAGEASKDLFGILVTKADVYSMFMMLPPRLQTPCFHYPHDAALAEYFVAA